MTGANLNAIRAQFPILHQQVNDHPLVYLDNAATTQKPASVIDAVSDYYRKDNANVHRAVHTLAGRATRAYEGARDTIQSFIGAARRSEIVFTRGTTEAINLVAHSWLAPRLRPGDEILVSGLEHHANIVPWQLCIEERGASIKVIPVREDGALDLEAYAKLLSEKTRLVALTACSNAIGTRNPVADMIPLAHAAGARVLVDAAQTVAHHRLDVTGLDADFVAFSAHKMFGPTGFGVLYGKEALLEEAKPWQGGGDMIETVSFAGSTWNELPYKFEAGTPNMAGAIGTAAAIRFLQDIDFDWLAQHEAALLQTATAGLLEVPGLRIIGHSPGKDAIISFVMDKAHPQDIGTLLDENGIAVRTGHHCAMPLMQGFGVSGTVRASFCVYNTMEEAESLARCLQRISKLFS